MTIGLPRQDPACTVWQQRLEGYVDAELEPHDAVAVREHLRNCPSCLAEVKTLTDMSQAMRALSVEGAPLGLWDRIEARLVGPRPAGEAAQRRPSDGWLTRRAALGLAAGVATALAGGSYALLSGRPSVVDASVDDFITYRARGWTVDYATRDARSLAAWAQARVGFAVPEIKKRFGAFEVGGVRLCWLLNRRLVGLTYANGEDRAVVYLMEAQGLALPAADRTLPDGARASVHHKNGHGVAVWTDSDLVFVLVAAEKDFSRALERTGQRAGNRQSNSDMS